MLIMVVTSGNVSLKFDLINTETNQILARGNMERIGKDGLVNFKALGRVNTYSAKMRNLEDAFRELDKALINELNGVIKDKTEIHAFCHKVLYGGENFKKHVLINDEAQKEIEKFNKFYPNIQTARTLGIKCGLKVFSRSKHVAVFETSFHTSMKDHAYRYAIPEKAYKEWGIRKYGFHGFAHEHVADEVGRILGNNARIISINIATGASVCAIKDGESKDITMGITPMEGLMMGTRCGDIDVSVVQFLMEFGKMSLPEAMDYLGKNSGILGVSELSSLISDVVEVYDKNSKAKLAVDMFCYRIRKYIGAYIAVLEGVDVIVFTGMVGENSAKIREKILDNLSCFGIFLDKGVNTMVTPNVAADITSPMSMVKVFVIPNLEEYNLAIKTEAFLNGKK